MKQAGNKTKSGLPKVGKAQRGASRQNARPPKGVQVISREAPAAKSFKTVRVGMSDLKAHRVSWLTGYIYVGNDTKGANDGVYFKTASNGEALVIGQVPVLGSDLYLGQTYVKDIEKHYARKCIIKCRLHIISLLPATTNSMTVVVAPVRGDGDTSNSNVVTNTTAALTLANVMGMEGAQGCASYEHMVLDLTPYIAGGTGPKQCEFAIDNVTYAGTSFYQNPGVMVVPCAFAVSGSNSTTTLRGSNTHMCIMEQWVDYLDYTGGVTLSYPALVEEVAAALSVLKIDPKDRPLDKDAIRARLVAAGRTDLVKMIDDYRPSK